MSMKDEVKNSKLLTPPVLVIVGTLLLQTLAFGAWVGSVDAHVTANSSWIEKNGTVSERLGNIETNQDWIKDALRRLLNTKGK